MNLCVRPRVNRSNIRDTDDFACSLNELRINIFPVFFLIIIIIIIVNIYLFYDGVKFQ